MANTDKPGGDLEDAPNPVQLRDDLLQFLFWMKGEGLAEAVSIPELASYLRQPEARLSEAANALLETGHLERDKVGGAIRLRLSGPGEIEGRRRFQEEFEPFLGHESHLVCDDPDCDCHSPDWQGDCLSLRARSDHR